MSERIHFQLDEKIILKLRKHWFMLLRDTLGSFIVGLLPFLVIPLLIAFGFVPQALLLYPAVAVFLATLWLLVIWMALAALWTNYYLDLWIVTNKRIISIDQTDLFSRKVTSLSLDKIQEISVTTDNVLETFFTFGTIQIETAGPTDLDTRMEGIPDPEKVRSVILEQTASKISNNQ